MAYFSGLTPRWPTKARSPSKSNTRRLRLNSLLYEIGTGPVSELHRKTISLTRGQTTVMRDQGLPEWKVREMYNKLVDSWEKGGRKLDNDTLIPPYGLPAKGPRTLAEQQKMSDDAVKAVLEHWHAHGVPYLAGVHDHDIAEFENQYGVRLPDGMRRFYRATNGTRVPLQTGQDHDSFEFYRLSEVTPDSRYSWAMNFADYCEMSWWYAVDLIGGGDFGSGAVYMLGARGGKPLVVAPSFCEFLDLYAREDDRIWQSGALAYHNAALRELMNG